MTLTKAPEYSILAEIYDAIMDDVDYDVWADFIDEIIQVHHPNPGSVLELACGTGSLSFALEKLKCYRITAGDKSPHMIAKARNKAVHNSSEIVFKQIDFLNIKIDRTYDIIVSIFDSINYIMNSDDLRMMLSQVKKVMHNHSLFIFDFTTPKNSRESIQFLNDDSKTTCNSYRFFRKSRYDDEQQIHYNTFEIERLAEDNCTVLERFTEEHRQRPYSLAQIRGIINETDFKIAAQYEEFDLDEATENSLRITMVLQCQKLNTHNS